MASASLRLWRRLSISAAFSARASSALAPSSALVEDPVSGRRVAGRAGLPVAPLGFGDGEPAVPFELRTPEVDGVLGPPAALRRPVALLDAVPVVGPRRGVVLDIWEREMCPHCGIAMFWNLRHSRSKVRPLSLVFVSFGQGELSQPGLGLLMLKGRGPTLCQVLQPGEQYTWQL